MKIYKIIS